MIFYAAIPCHPEMMLMSGDPYMEYRTLFNTQATEIRWLSYDEDFSVSKLIETTLV